MEKKKKKKERPCVCLINTSRRLGRRFAHGRSETIMTTEQRSRLVKAEKWLVLAAKKENGRGKYDIDEHL